MKEQHPPMTGLEVHFEDELAATKQNKSQTQSSTSKPKSDDHEKKQEPLTLEESMVLGR